MVLNLRSFLCMGDGVQDPEVAHLYTKIPPPGSPWHERSASQG